jgi:Holliday junction resolvasome RuvABC endonuclease subunit
VTTLCLGIDPGATRSGLSLVRLDPNGWLNIDYGAHVDNETDAWRQMVTSTIQRGGVIVLEMIVGYAYDAFRVQPLVETGRMEGRVLELVRLLKGKVITVEALDVRGRLCRSRKASDAQVQIVVEGVTRGRPAHLTQEAKTHIYDAAAAAIDQIAQASGRPLVVPAEVEARLHLQREADKVERAARRAGGGEKPKRSLTRAQSERRSKGAKQAWAIRKGGA